MAIEDRIARDAFMFMLESETRSLERSDTPFQQAAAPEGSVVFIETEGACRDTDATGQTVFTYCFVCVAEDPRITDAISKLMRRAFTPP